ncbi:MAG: hypothetical protein LRY73_12305 [Bacillus sp. (in: Bacteria)]|nr:hypothetical protein [Bacillus sp. (in: firmicutes)]
MHDREFKEEQIKNWYFEYSNLIFRYILVMIGERQQARDLMQETLIKAYKNMDHFQGESSPKTWLYRLPGM